MFKADARLCGLDSTESTEWNPGAEELQTEKIQCLEEDGSLRDVYQTRYYKINYISSPIKEQEKEQVKFKVIKKARNFQEQKSMHRKQRRIEHISRLVF